MTRDEVIWLAGLLEGEGCFYLQRARGRWPRAYPSLRLQMTDRDVVERAARLMGCATQSKPSRDGHQDTWLVQLLGWPAIDVMRAIRPWMGERRTAKIDGLVALYADAYRRGGDECRRGHALSDENVYVNPTTGSRRCRACHSAWRATNRTKVKV